MIALAVVIYILEHQPSFTLDKSYYTVYAQFQTGAAVTAGQGQAVDIAGVEVGQVGGVKLENGRAVVTMNIFKKYQPIYQDATVLLRPRTPLKDMYLALDPGTPDGRGGARRRHAQRVEHQPRRRTSTRSWPRWTPTPATTCCCCSRAAQARSTNPGRNGRGAQPQRGAPTCAACSSGSRR